ncbi:MAG: penicillin-binding protein 2 [Capsulimonadales bacterium]|nr:penicillin-binding protein 2 [Capsulimonadales bacterium]
MATIRTTKPNGPGAYTRGRRPNPALNALHAAARENARVAARETTGVVVQERVLPIFLLLALAHAALAARLVYLQVVKRNDFVREARELRSRTVELPARRGEMLDRYGNPLVRNEPVCDIVLDPNLWFAARASDETAETLKRSAIERLSALLPGIDVRGIVEKRGIVKGSTGSYRTIVIAREMPEKLGERIKQQQILGAGVRPAVRRSAVLGDLAPQVVGITGTDGEGLEGLESALQHGPTYSLKGRPGELQAEFDSRGMIPGTIRNHRPPQHGTNFVLTLDADLQHTVQEALGKAFLAARAEAATAVVLDPATGDILALANYPTFDINHWEKSDSVARMNRAVTATFEPGSTMKVFTIAAALEEGKITPESHFFCNWSRRIGRRTIHCHDGQKHRNQDVTTVLANSCNIGTAEIGFGLGQTRLYHYLRKFGFGERPKSGLPGEEPGVLEAPEKWSDIRWANIAFGQGMTVNAIQMAAAYGAIANDGMYRRPRIVRGIRDEVGQTELRKVEEGRQVISPRTARTVRKMLLAAMEVGTGKPARLDGYTAGGKTATAQVARTGGRGYSPDEFISSFIGIAPVEKPRFVIAVSVSKPKGGIHYGGAVAGPVFKEIAEKALLAWRVPRDGVLRDDKKSVATAASD